MRRERVMQDGGGEGAGQGCCLIWRLASSWSHRELGLQMYHDAIHTKRPGGSLLYPHTHPPLQLGIDHGPQWGKTVYSPNESNLFQKSGFQRRGHCEELLGANTHAAGKGCTCQSRRIWAKYQQPTKYLPINF
jgi:hypothetical protein